MKPPAPQEDPATGRLGTAWVLSLITGPALGFLAGASRGPAFYPDTWSGRLWARLLLASTPLLLGLLHGLELRRREGRPALGPALIGLLGALTAWPAALDLLHGPRREEVEVARVEVAGAPRRGRFCCSSWWVTLPGGAEVLYGQEHGPRPERGQHLTLDWLPSTGAVLAANAPAAGQPGSAQRPRPERGPLFGFAALLGLVAAVASRLRGDAAGVVALLGGLVALAIAALAVVS